eukprot:jgi/Chlat1/8145/Chrsp76S07602
MARMDGSAVACICMVALLALLVAPADANGYRWRNGLRAPINMTAQLGAAPFRIVVPSNWKGVLILDGHGYIAKLAEGRVDYPFELGTDGFPSKEHQEPYISNVGGYAVATTKYSSEGWSVQEALKELPRLTRFFRTQIASPARTIISGGSMSAIPAIALAENHRLSGPPSRKGRLYNGAFAFCGISAGTSETVNYLMTVAKVYDAIFGIPAEWGTAGKLNPNLNFSGPAQTDPAATIVFKLCQAGIPLCGAFQPPYDKEVAFKFELIRLLLFPTLPKADVYPSAGFIGWMFGNMFFTFQVRWDIQTRAGGAITGTDVGVTYGFNKIAQAQGAEKYLKDTFGIDPAPYIAKMNAAPKIIADPAGKAYAKKYTDFTGNLHIPMITMHNLLDGQVRTSNEAFYSNLVKSAGKSHLLYHTWVDTYPNLFIGSNGPPITSSGHCIFTKEQMLAAFNSLDDWVAKGERPVKADFTPAGGFDFNFKPLEYPLS